VSDSRSAQRGESAEATVAPASAGRQPLSQTGGPEHIGNRAMMRGLTAGTGSLSPALVARLQRQIGNRGVGAVLGTSPLKLARAPMPVGEVSKHKHPPTLLTRDEKESLENAAASRVVEAFVAFAQACKAHQESLKAEAKAEAEMVAATVDIFFGLGAPAFAAGVMVRGGKVAKVAEKISGRMSVASADKTIKLISESDLLKESFKAVGKIGTTAIKLNASALFGEGDEDLFARQLRDQFHAGVQAITDKLHLHELTDEQVVATFLAYDVEYTSESAYVETLKKTFKDFKKYVRPVGARAQGFPGLTPHRRAVWMNAYGRTRLAVIADETSVSGKIFFAYWIPEDMEAFVIAKTKRLYGTVETIDTAAIYGHIPDPVTEKDYATLGARYLEGHPQ
jgi:hypothetical protein